MTDHNRTPEQRARAAIDTKLEQAGWRVQSMAKIDFGAGVGIAVREYPTDVGPADYVLFIEGKAVGVIEAKRDEWGHKITAVEDQSNAYATAVLKWVNNSEPLPFVYESTGEVTRFTNRCDPVPRSREVFSFPRPETMREWAAQPDPLRKRLHRLPHLDPAGLRDCQINAIENLEASFKRDRPRALIQMATGSGKTYTAITAVYRLLKHADAKRVLFLVDTRNLGEQAQQEFMAYVPSDDNRKFVELYNVQRLTSSFVAGDSQVCISTIQRMYSILKGEEMDAGAEEINPAELVQPRQPPPVVYNPTLPPEFFDFIIIDECHRSIYDLWRQVLEYFDAYRIGLTATPDNRTYGFFRKNVVSEYSHEQAVADGVNVGFTSVPVAIMSTVTAMQSNISGSKLLDFPFPFCSIEEQRKIVRTLGHLLSQVGETEKGINRQLDTAAAVRQAILRRAFSGQLVTQDPDDEPASAFLSRITAERVRTANNSARGKSAKITA